MNSLRLMAFAIAALLSAAGHAQPIEKMPDPSDPSAASHAVQYQSAFSDYLPLDASEPSPAKTWRAANDEMARIGGHAGQIKDAPAASAPDAAGPAPAAAQKPAPAAAPAGHDMHKMERK